MPGRNGCYPALELAHAVVPVQQAEPLVLNSLAHHADNLLRVYIGQRLAVYQQLADTPLAPGHHSVLLAVPRQVAVFCNQ